MFLISRCTSKKQFRFVLPFRKNNINSKINLMKRIFILFACTFLYGLVSLAGNGYPVEYVLKAPPRSADCLEIPSDFSKNGLTHTEQLKALANKQVKRIELWYTAYKENPAFDQQALNQQRINRLRELYPSLKDPSIQWELKEQTGASTRDEAANYFHGFRIYPQETSTVQPTRAIDDPANPFQEYQVNNETGRTIQTASGSVLYVPPHAVTDETGNTVQGTYTIRYKEYRDAAQIALSGIPMTYQNASGTYAFNSAGMFEIRGNQNGKEVFLQKSIQVDFMGTAVLKDCNYYSLDDASGLWNKEHTISFGQNAVQQQILTMNQIVEKNAVHPEIKRDAPANGMDTDKEQNITWYSDKDLSYGTLNEQAWANYLKLKQDRPKFVENILVEENRKDHKLTGHRANFEKLMDAIFGMEIQVQMQTNATLLAEGADKGHTYPTLVRGLNSPSFGVYNCDQQYRMQDLLTFNPTYLSGDSENNTPISNPDVVCVINKAINGSFSFDPKAITISESAPCVLLVFTKDKRVFYLSEEAVSASNFHKNKNVYLTEITDQVKDSKQLKEFLAI